ncbi:putative head-closure protein [Vibrio phage 424E50-1]|nr:putative head-closure protein [Vibrio phage 424E50-1]
MAFTILGDRQVVYKEVITKTPDWLDNGILKKGTETITYQEIECNHEPFDAEEAELTPTSVGSRDSRWLYTTELLNTYLDFETNSTMADKVYLTDPTRGRAKPQAYTVYDRESWEVTESFELLDSSYDYIIVREGKL